ncbi:MAG: hypothetical protein EXS14_00865 [Planctomycetes bacterium]|nr:hypothetical protein [Planctomycetota bacterium]
MGLKQGGMTRAWRTGVFANVVLICALAASVAVGTITLVRQLSWQHDLRFDLTAERTYSLSAADTSMLRALEAPVTVLFAWGVDRDIAQRVLDAQGAPRADLLAQHYRPLLQDAARRVHRVLEEWSHVTPHLTYNVIDADSAPRELEIEARRLGYNPEDLLNTVLLVQGSRRREIPLRRMMHAVQWGFFPAVAGALPRFPQPPSSWGISEELAPALRALCSGSMPLVGVVVGHDSLIETGSRAFADLGAFLQSEGYEGRALEIARAESLLPFACIIVPAPKKPLSARDMEQLRDYEQAGGRILLIGDPRFAEDYARLLEPFGTRLLSQVVDDRRLRDPSRESAADLQSMSFCVGQHAVDSPLKDRAALYLGPTRPIQVGTDHAPGVERVPLLRASADADAIPVTHDSSRGTYAAIEGQRSKAANAILGVAVNRTHQGSARESRVIVLGGGGILSPDEFALATHFGNRDLLLNCMTWLCDRPFSPQQSAREEARPRLVSVAALSNPLRWVAVIVLPLLAFAVAIAVHLVRRSP